MINRFLSLCIITFRPLLGPATCRYSFTCTNFALELLSKEPFYKAIPLIVSRLLSCNPFTK
ncbi:MAG: membrane protein insertion efficiency factor YidD [Proteobacteria bacterium]|nr:membrane protein insertion efficiency factor YidD [Pseudomonadota bacterium]